MRSSRAVLAIALAASAVVATESASAAGPPAPIDPQNWSFQDNLTWSDYKPIPGPDYSDPSIAPTVRKWRVALILADYPDRPFTVTLPAGGTVFGTPTAMAHSIPREQVPQFYADFLNKPQALNHFQTMNRYWMEDSFGKYGVELVPFGPYKLPDRAYQYGINFYANNNFCPTPALTPCRAHPNNVIRNDIRALWQADVGAAKIAEFDNIFYTFAGEDQSSTWQEFGEMKFADQNSVPDAFGPKAIDPSLPNWAPTRYVPWSSWAVATNIWPNAQGNNSIEAESSGMSTYAHELSHNLSIPDNYGNPFGTVQQRGFTGMWDMMSRGTFNGPGGQHTRYNIPPTQGAALGSQHNIRNKRFLNFIGDADLLRLNRNGLAQSGMAVADVTAREVPRSAGEVAGFQIALDGTVGDNAQPCTVATDWR